MTYNMYVQFSYIIEIGKLYRVHDICTVYTICRASRNSQKHNTLIDCEKEK